MAVSMNNLGCLVMGGMPLWIGTVADVLLPLCG